MIKTMKKNNEEVSVPKTSFWSRCSFSSASVIAFIIGAFVVMGPLMWIPKVALSVSAGKGYLIVFGFLVMSLFYGIHILRKGEIVIPKHFIFKMLGLLVVFGFVGSLFAPSFGMSFWGYGFETTTWLFSLVFAGVVFFSSQVIRSRDQIIGLLIGMILPVVVLIVLHISRFFLGTDFANLFILKSMTDSLVGSWADFQILLGITLLMIVIAIELGSFKKITKAFFALFALIPISILFAVNAKMVFVIIGFMALLGSLYLFSFAFWDTREKVYGKKQRAPWAMLILLVVMITGIFVAPATNAFVEKYRTIGLRDTRPSITATVQVAEKSIVRNFITGYGANSFGGVWNKVKPVSLSGTSLGSSDFSIGFGYIPTQMATGGIATIIIWILFIGSLFMVVIRKITRGFENDSDRHLLSSFGLVVISMTVFSLVYVPGNSVLLLFAIFVGGFLGVAASDGDVHEKTFSFIKDPRVSFFGILGITILIGATVVGGFFIARKMSSLIHYSQGINLLAQNKKEEGSNQIAQAIALYGHDVYYYKTTELALQQARTVTAGANQTNKDQVSKQVEQILGSALGYAGQAVSKNNMEYKNHVLLGTVYQTMVTFGVSDAYDKALDAYREAVVRNPNDSTMNLLFANLALAKKDTAGALQFIKESINTYPTRDAYLLRSQIEISSQKWTSAIASLSQAMVYNNTDVITYITLGIMYEKTGDLVNAQKIYDVVKSRFSDGGEVIQKIKSNLGLNTPVTPAVVAPNQKKK